MRHSSRSAPGAARRVVVAFAALAVAVPAGAFAATPAHAAEPPPKTAVVGPLLDFFGFGATVGAPLLCGVVSSSLGSGFQEFGAADQGNAVVSGIDSGCDAFSTQGGEFVDQGKTAQAPYAGAFNPYADPAIGQFADAVSEFGRTYGSALAPFGPTVEGAGNTIKFFRGGTPK